MPGKKSWKERVRGHGNIFTPHAGSMLIHVHRENGLAHRTMTLRPWQVQALRLITSRWFVIILAVGFLSWGYFAIQSARIPFLVQRITHMEEDALRLDTLQAKLTQLQARYDQVQLMLSVPSASGRKIEKGARGDSATVARPH